MGGDVMDNAEALGDDQELVEVPVITGRLSDDLRRYLLAALPSEECTVLEQYGFEPCCDHPELSGHRYAEGYFHGLRKSPHRLEPSVHPRFPAEATLQRRPARLPFVAFCEAFRQQNAPMLEELSKRLETTSLQTPLLRGAHFADVSVQLNWGSAVPPEHAAWHTDAAYSLLHLALGLQGERTLLAHRQRRRRNPGASEEPSLDPPDSYESLHQREGAVYLSAPSLFPHAVEYPEASWEQRIVSVQCRFLLHPDELPKVKAELETTVGLERAILSYLREGVLLLPTLQEVQAVQAQLAAEEASLENCLKVSNPNFLDLYGESDSPSTSPLHLAVERGHLGVARLLADHPEFRKLNQRDAAGNTALHIAAHQGHAEITKCLMDHSKFLEVNTKNNDGHTVLHIAVYMGHSGVFQQVLKHWRFSSQDKRSGSGGTVLHSAAEMGRVQMVEDLLSTREFTEVVASDKEGNTAMHVAAGMGHAEALRTLLQQPRTSKSGEARNRQGSTLLHMAAASGHCAAAAALLNHPGFRLVNAWDGFGNTALHTAAGVGAADVSRLLLDSHSFKEPNGRNSCGGTALHVAARTGHSEAALVLLGHDRFTAVNAKNDEGNTALHFAAKKGHVACVQTLLDHPRFTKVDAQNSWRRTAADTASNWGHKEVLQVLLDWGKRRERGTAGESGDAQTAGLKAVLAQLPEDFSVCYLGFHTGEPLPPGEQFEGPLVQQEDGWLAGLWCYLISRPGAEMMLEQAVPFPAQVDSVVGILAVQDGRCYTVPPGQFLAFSPPTEESLDSDIQTWARAPETEEELQAMMEAIPEEGRGTVQLFSDIALHDAALQGLGDVCLQIIGQPDSAPDLNARDASGQTALHAAAWAGLTNVCTAILDRSEFSEINALDDEGNSVLHAAAFKGLTTVCSKILEKSGFTEAAACDCDERTASSLAEEKGHVELAEMLRKHGA